MGRWARLEGGPSEAKSSLRVSRFPVLTEFRSQQWEATSCFTDPIREVKIDGRPSWARRRPRRLRARLRVLFTASGGGAGHFSAPTPALKTPLTPARALGRRDQPQTPGWGRPGGRAQLREGEAGEAGAAAPHAATPTQRCEGGVTWGKALPSLSTVFSDFPPSLDAGLEKENMYA